MMSSETSYFVYCSLNFARRERSWAKQRPIADLERMMDSGVSEWRQVDECS